MNISDYNKQIKTLATKEAKMKERFEYAKQALVEAQNELQKAKAGKSYELKCMHKVKALSKKYDIDYEVDEDWIADWDEWRCVVPVPEWFTDEQCYDIGYARGDVIEGDYCWADVLQRVEEFVDYHPKYINEYIKEKILKDEGVKEIIPASGTDPQEYKWELILKPGYRVEGYETHTKHLFNLKDYYNHTIEPCPKDCGCGQGNAL